MSYTRLVSAPGCFVFRTISTCHTTIFSKIRLSTFKMAYSEARKDLLDRKQIIEKEGTARQHGDTLEKRGISVDDLLNPSRGNHSKKIKYFSRVSFGLGRSYVVKAIL